MEQLANGSSSAQPGDWVKELFAPIYDFDDIVNAGKEGYKIKDSIIKRVPILEPQAIKDVFERVHQRVIESETKRLQDQKEKLEEKRIKQIDPRKSSIWDTDELDTLRQVYKASKGEIHKLEMGLRECKAHNEALENHSVKQRNEIEKLRFQLAEVVKCNQRLTIHRDSLQKDMAVLEVKQAALTDMWHEIEKEKTKAMSDANEARKELDTVRLNCQRLENDILEANQNLIREKALAESNLKTKYEIEIKDLQEVVRDLTVELRDERQRHLATKRGLDHLRNHFSSIPLQEIVPSCVVDKDQVSEIDHLGS